MKTLIRLMSSLLLYPSALFSAELLRQSGPSPINVYVTGGPLPTIRFQVQVQKLSIRRSPDSPISSLQLPCFSRKNGRPSPQGEAPQPSGLKLRRIRDSRS